MVIPQETHFIGPSLRSFRLEVAYDGTDFAGWQVQPGQRTIQGELERALTALTGSPVKVIGSGRTDAGVHALCQAASTEMNTTLRTGDLWRALNAHLPSDLIVSKVAESPPGFHAIRDCLSKRYRYQIDDRSVPNVFLRKYAWHHRQPLDTVAMHDAGRAFVGEHDFESFRSSGAQRQSSVRNVFELTVRREMPQEGSLVTVEVAADGFLYNMVRAIVGTLCYVGRGTHKVDWPSEVLAACDRTKAGPTAPPHGLFLKETSYSRQILNWQSYREGRPAHHTTTEINKLKAQIRSEVISKRREYSDRGRLSARIMDRISALPAFLQAKNILFFVGSAREVQTKEYLAKALLAGKQVWVPYCKADELGVFHLKDMRELAPGAYGILEPRPELISLAGRQVSLRELDLILVPGVAFDSGGARLGHGKGYYDRLLQRTFPHTLLVAPAFECQIVPYIPVSSHDAFVDVVVTESAIHQAGGPSASA